MKIPPGAVVIAVVMLLCGAAVLLFGPQGHEQHAARIGAIDDEMRHAVRQRIGFAGPGAGDHEQRRRGTPSPADPMLDGAPLFRIERVEIGRLHCRLLFRCACPSRTD